ncbi:glutaminase GtaA [Purpureocillium lilacinum]|uniref:Glutaminase GtaA n=1 Tax=Purpureocillium lilacinum TaxID=33203 RepID=A0A179HJW5_PURLI|nr:glutaminase GtaA [Purpureocillium lilacinum]KAK4095420.1 hypothetical protein Purlil1_216 [Purpureocillium lilacinum]OAQ90294.1 glutaminase GtaA [Purpureocillium lilacinum]GJN78449.1 hypothetical protein PLIIFM63780_001943 [Purpureocillium lilacinum]
MKFFKLAAAAALALLGNSADAASTFSPARPPAVPLAVRSPYLNVWLNGKRDGSPSGYLPGNWPVFWSQYIQGWQGFIRVDGHVYNWMGNAPGGDGLVNQTSLEYTSTRSVFTFNVVDKVEMMVEFLSPVYPEDLRRQSVTSSYINISVKSLDGKTHSVQIYSDVSGEWASGDNSQVIQWESVAKDGVRYHKFWRKEQQKFTEQNEVAAWGNWYWATGDQRGVSYQIGSDGDVRGQFLNKGYLTGEIDTNFRAVRDRWPVFGLARDLGFVAGTAKSTLFTIGFTQDEAINFQGKEDNTRSVPALWKEYFNEQDLVTFFYKDFDYASHYANRLDLRIARDSEAAAGRDYATITTLAVRQVFGALAYTNTKDSPLVFLKEISSNSDIQTVDVIFPAFPIMLYLNPDMIKWTLEPLLENGRYHYPNSWAQHDLGTFPNAVGHPKGDDEPMPLEECGNMVVMMLAYAQRKHNDQYLADNWDLLEKWAGYLIEDAKIPANQLSTDDFAGHLANQTNLAIKGIIALEAMSQIAKKTGHKTHAANYTEIAHEYLEFWTNHGINHNAEPKHTVLQYDNPDTYGLLYNVYSDKVLNLNFIPQEIYDMQSDFYPTIENEYGVILDTRGTLTKLDWEMWAAAVAKPETRYMFISKIASWINRTTTWRAYTDLYDTKDGGYPRGIEFTARPVQGGVFSILALKA